MRDTPKYSIRKAGAQDLLAISSLVKQAAVAQEGELGSACWNADSTTKDGKRLLRRHPQSYVLIVEGVVVAFLLGQGERELDPTRMISLELFTRSMAPFTVMQQVLVAPEYRRMGLGSALVRHFIREAGCDVFAAIVMDADAAEAGTAGFCRRLGFEKAFELIREDGRNWWLFRRRWGTDVLGHSKEVM